MWSAMSLPIWHTLVYLKGLNTYTLPCPMFEINQKNYFEPKRPARENFFFLKRHSSSGTYYIYHGTFFNSKVHSAMHVSMNHVMSGAVDVVDCTT